MTENEARQMEVEIKWNGRANVCVHCGKVPETYYITTGHDHTDDSIRYCFCRSVAPSTKQLQAKVAELEEEIERLRADNIAFARNLKGKSATTGATYEHICTQLAAAQEEILIERSNGDHWRDAYSKWVNTDESARRLIELQEQLAAAQEEINSPPAIDSYEMYMADDEESNPVERLRFFLSLALKDQDWIDVEKFIDEVSNHIAKTEQRVAEAFIECMVVLKQQDFAFTGSTVIGIEKCEAAIRSGEWRKHMKGD